MLQQLLKPFHYINCKATSHFLRQAINIKPGRRKEGDKLLYLAASCLPYHISGYTTRTQALLDALCENGAQVMALTRTGYPWDRKDRLQDAACELHREGKVTYHHISSPGRLRQVAHYALGAAAEIEKFARANGVGCIHAASNHVNALPGLIAARRLGIPFQYEMRGLWELSRASRYPEFYNSPAFHMGLELEGLVASKADRVFTISRQLGNYAAKRWQIDSQKITLLPNCLTGELAETLPEEEPQPNLLGYAGSLVEYEGLDVLLESIAHLRTQGMKVLLHIIGDGEARGRLEQLAEKLDLMGQVSFLGRLDPSLARKHLQKCSAVCLPRKPYEVCHLIPPFKLVEAMAMAKALFVPDLPVFREELGELATGWIFEPANAKSLASLLQSRLSDAGALKEQGRKLRARAMATRQWKHFIPSLLKKMG